VLVDMPLPLGEEALFITLRMSLEHPEVIKISGDMKFSMFAHGH